MQEAVTSMAMYGAIHALVITNREYTKKARVLAQKNGVELWNRNILIGKLAKASKAKRLIQPLFLQKFLSNSLRGPMMVPSIEMEIAEEILPSVNDDEPYIPF